MNKAETLLTDEEKIESITAVMEDIETLGYTDILIVGGEVYCQQSPAVADKLRELFTLIKNRIFEDKTRILYMNTNLLYEDMSMIESLLWDFSDGYRDRVRFTTSYDIEGRFANEEARALFLKNLKNITMPHWNVTVAVNMILTKPFCNAIINKELVLSEFMREYPAKYINTIPYIPLGPDDPMKPTEHEIFATLYTIERDAPHYINYYINQYDSFQDRTLKEYRRGEGLVECTSSYSDCGHNSNYKKVLDSGECFVCKIKEELGNLKVLTDEKLEEFVRQKRYIITIGDVCSSYIWSNFRQPDYVVFDGENNDDGYRDIIRFVREHHLTRKVLVNDTRDAGQELEHYMRMSLHDTSKTSLIQVVGEEDGAFLVAMRFAKPGDVIVSGDENRKCMVYYEVKYADDPSNDEQNDEQS